MDLRFTEGLSPVPHLDSMSVIDLNRMAMHYLSREMFRECYRLLKQAESVLESDIFKAMMAKADPAKRERMESLTLNNIGCYYKKIGKPNVALSYMYKALAIESKDGSSGTRCSQAGTKLNICAILSS
jgi:hypothetical protein